MVLSWGAAQEQRMTSTHEVVERLSRLGLELPTAPPPPAGSYVPCRLHGGLGFLAAQVPQRHLDGSSGRVGADLSLLQGRSAARSAGLNALARIHQALGGFERLAGLLHVAAHVASTDTFIDQPAVADGASELFVAVLAEAGQHTRTAYGPPRLPHDVSVELEITFAYVV